MSINHKTPRTEKEYANLLNVNPKLCDILDKLSHFVKEQFNKDIVITSLYRTPEEQGALNPAVKKSPHTMYHAVDLRSSIYTQEEIDKMVDFLNDLGKKYSNVYKTTALYHVVPGSVYHFHVQGF